MRFRRIILSTMVLIGIVYTQSIVTKVGTSAGNWLKIETGARAIGMGGAHVAAGEGVSAMPFNPASIGFIQGSEMYTSSTNYVAGIKHYVFAYGTQITPTDYIGFHMFYLNSGDMPETTVEFPEGTGKDFAVTNWAFRMTYAKHLTDRLRVGGTIKYIRENIYKTYMQSFVLDVGSNFDTGIYGFILGMSVSNFGPDVQFQGEGLQKPVDDENVDGILSEVTGKFSLPMTFRLGIKNDIIGENSVFAPMSGHRLTIAADAINPIDYTLNYSVGAEYAWNEMAFARCGTHIGHDTAGLSAGLGIKLGGIGVDYAFSSFGILEDTHQFGLSFGF